MANPYISILSLAVAAIAVFVGPYISWKISKKQANISLYLTNKQLTGPMRQAWINNLRDMIAELCASALHYTISGYEDRKDQDYYRIEYLRHKIELMLNPTESDHKELISAIGNMINGIGDLDYEKTKFPDRHTETMRIAQQVFKREWNVIKESANF